METNLILNALRQSIKELAEEKYLQERKGISKAALDFIDMLESKANEDQGPDATAILPRVRVSLHIDFAVYLTGHDKETIEQMYNDWRQ